MTLAFKRLVHVCSQYFKESWFMFCFVFGYLWLGMIYRLPPHRLGTKQPIVLIPGFLGKGLEFGRLRKALIASGHPVYIVPLGSQMGDIEKKRDKVSNYLKTNDLNHCLLVGYSMGGLVAAGLKKSDWERVDHFITIGVAFRGTPMAYFLPFFIASWQLMPHSSLLKKYQQKLQFVKKFHTNILAKGDEIAPYHSSYLQSGRQVFEPEFGHLNLVMGKDAINRFITMLSQNDYYLR